MLFASKSLTQARVWTELSGPDRGEAAILYFVSGQSEASWGASDRSGDEVPCFLSWVLSPRFFWRGNWRETRFSLLVTLKIICEARHARRWKKREWNSENTIETLWCLSYRPNVLLSSFFFFWPKSSAVSTLQIQKGCFGPKMRKSPSSWWGYFRLRRGQFEIRVKTAPLKVKLALVKLEIAPPEFK